MAYVEMNLTPFLKIWGWGGGCEGTLMDSNLKASQILDDS